MAEATTYWNGLTRQGKILLQVNTDSATFPAYIGIIAVAEGLPSNYYILSLERDSRFNSIDYPTEFFVDIETDLGIALVDGDVFIARPLSEGLTKEERQVMKLEISAKKRTRDGNARDTYDITQLPDTYNGNVPNGDDNPNLGELTLTPGVVQAGIRKVTYTGYHNDDVAFTDTATATASTTANDFVIASIAENTTVLYTGYLLGTYTGDWTFTLTGDDSSYLWIGADAVSGYTTVNRTAFANYNTVGTVTVAITAGEYYPVRLLYGNGPSTGYLNLTYAHTGQTATNNFTGKLFSPGVTLVEGRPWITTP